MSYDNFTHGGCKVDRPEPMTRVEETEAILKTWRGQDGAEHLARTLAAEVDELRRKLDDVRMNIGCAEAAQRDEAITKLLEILKPHSKMEANWVTPLLDRHELYSRACEIAGRAE